MALMDFIFRYMKGKQSLCPQLTNFMWTRWPSLRYKWSVKAKTHEYLVHLIYIIQGRLSCKKKISS